MRKFLLALCLLLQTSLVYAVDLTIIGLPCLKVITLDNNWTLVCIMSEAENRKYLNSVTTNDRFLLDAYMMLLYRYPDDGGFKWWLGQLTSGAMTKDQIIDAFIGSAEYKSLHP